MYGDITELLIRKESSSNLFGKEGLNILSHLLLIRTKFPGLGKGLQLLFFIPYSEISYDL